MSIDKTRQFLEKSGCSVVIPIVIAGVLIFGIGYNSCSKSDSSAQYNQEYKQSIIAKIGKHHIQTQDLLMLANSINKNRKPNNIIDEINVSSQACQASINQEIMVYLAEEKKIDLSNKNILDFFEQEMKDQVESIKQQLISTGKLKANASEKEFHEVIKKETKQDIHNWVDKQRKEIKQGLEDKDKKDRIIGSFAPSLLTKHISNQIKVTDDEVKAQFNQLTAQKIEFTKNKGKNITQAKQALIALRNGKTIDQVRKEFGADTPKKGQEEISLPMQFVNLIPEYAPLAKLKIGEYTEISSHGDTASIYKLIKIAPSLPPEYAKNADSYRKRLIAQKANEQIKKEIESIEKSSKLEWLSKPYQINYDYNQYVQNLSRQAQIDKEVIRLKYLDFAKQAESNINDVSGSFIAKGTSYLALRSALQISTPEQVKELYDQRIRTITNLLQNVNDPGLLLELTNLYLEKKNKDTGETLVAAAEALNNVDEDGNAQYQQIDQLTKKLSTEKLLTPEQLKKLEKENTRWKTERKQYEEAKAKQAKPAGPMPDISEPSKTKTPPSQPKKQ